MTENVNIIATIYWERLDVPGNDECRVLQTENGWRLEGYAEFSEGGQDHKIDYSVDCAANWNTWRAEIKGTSNLVISRRSGEWFLDGQLQEDIASSVTQIDFGFTPATNFIQLKQMDLKIGQSDDCVVAWFDLGEGELSYLHQHYERTGERTYAYDSPSYGYHETLTIAESGFVGDYPHLWRKIDE